MDAAMMKKTCAANMLQKLQSMLGSPHFTMLVLYFTITMNQQTAD